MSAQFLHNNLVKFCCARLNIFKLCILKTLILKGLNRYDLPIALCPLKRTKETKLPPYNIFDNKELDKLVELKE